MTVSELIDILKTFPPEHEAIIWATESGGWSPINVVQSIYEDNVVLSDEQEEN